MGIPIAHYDPETGERDIDALGEAVDEYQLEHVWAPLGWRVADETTIAVAHVGGGVIADLEGRTCAQLVAIGRAAGAPVRSSMKKDELIETIREHAAPVGEEA